MGCFNTLFILLIGIIYFVPNFRPLMEIEGFWFTIGAVWLCFFVSWVLFGGIADNISGVNNFKDSLDE